MAGDDDRVVLRPARPGDERAVAEVHVASWQAAYRGLLPDDYLDALRAEERAERYTFGAGAEVSTILVAAADRVVGFATVDAGHDATAPGAAGEPGAAGQPGAGEAGEPGELYALYLDRAWWGRGVGRALMVAARDHLTGAGFTEAVLWVLAGNARAERFYRIDGWAPDGERRSNNRHGVPTSEVRYLRRLD